MCFGCVQGNAEAASSGTMGTHGPNASSVEQQARTKMNSSWQDNGGRGRILREHVANALKWNVSTECIVEMIRKHADTPEMADEIIASFATHDASDS